MAYSLGFPKDVTDLLYSMRDWRLEELRAAGGTPVARMLHAHVTIERDPPPATFTTRAGAIYDEWEWTIELLQEMGERPLIRVTETPVPRLTHGYVFFPDECYTDLARRPTARDAFYSELPEDLMEGVIDAPPRLIEGGWPH